MLAARSNVRVAVVVVASLLAACGGSSTKGPSGPSVVDLSTGEAARLVLGQPDFTSFQPNRGGSPAADTFRRPWGNPTVAGGRLYLPDRENHRVLVFDALPAANGAAASFVLGQASMSTAVSGRTEVQVNGPDAVSASGGKLVLADGNGRVLVWDALPVSTAQPATRVVGKSSLTEDEAGCDRQTLSTTEGAIAAGGKLIVSDSGHHRVLVWNTIPTTSDYAPADLVLGQPDFTTCGVDPVVSATTMNWPKGVWSDGVRLVVADSSNQRVLLWNSFPTSNRQAADVVLGRPDFSASGPMTGAARTWWPTGVASNGTQLAVADCWTNRVLVWNAFPTSNGQAADVVLGQPDGDTFDSGISATRMNCPSGVHLTGDLLLVADSNNSRYLVFR